MQGLVSSSSFSFGESKVEVRFEKNDKIWFSAKDVGICLGYKNIRDALIRHCREKGVVKYDVLTKGGKQQVSFIDEPNLYRLIMASKMESAEIFQDWVTEEVLPSIRKTGTYSVNEPKIIQQPLITIPRFKNDSVSSAHKELMIQFKSTFISIYKRIPTNEEYGKFVSGVNKKVFGYHEKGMRGSLTSHGYIVAINTFDEICRSLKGSRNIGTSVQSSVDRINLELKEVKFPELATEPFALITSGTELVA